MFGPENSGREVIEPVGPPPVWGPWATAGLGLAIIVVSVIVQAIIAVIFFVIELVPMSRMDFDVFNYTEFLDSIDMGLLISLSIIISAIVCLGLIFVFVKARRGAAFSEYIGFRSIGVAAIFIVLAISIGYIGLSALVNLVLDIPQETDIMTEAYATSVWPALFWLASIVFAPLFEEVFFRGFLYEGFRHSRMGAAGAIIVTALVWAGFHLQYQLFQIASIFVLGVIFGVVRNRTGSLWATMLMHSFHNFVAVLFLTIDIGV
jgi:membrane protease YdiL (CAAX protease family)